MAEQAGTRPTGSETSGRLDRKGGEQIAWRRRAGSGPTVLWLGGFRSDMGGTKADTLDRAAETHGWDYVRFDYYAHGESSGDWAEVTIGRWREDALAVIDQLTDGPLVLVGSSMGGWIACLAAMVRPERVKAMVLIAPAPDFTEVLMKPRLSAEAQAAIEKRGEWIETGGYEGPYAITRKFLDDGRNWQILGAPIPIHAPVRILQGQLDPDVPWTHALKLADQLATQDVMFSLIKDGDHRLSTPINLARIVAAVRGAVGLVE